MAAGDQITGVTRRTPRKKSPGRPSKLTAATTKAIVVALEAGSYREEAARAAGIGASTLRHWMELGEADAEQDRDTPHSRIRAAIIAAEAQAEVNAVALIRKAAMEGTWTAAAWLLERKYPVRWGRRERHEVQVAADVEVVHSKVVEVVPEGDQRLEIAQILAGALGVNGHG